MWAVSTPPGRHLQRASLAPLLHCAPQLERFGFAWAWGELTPELCGELSLAQGRELGAVVCVSTASKSEMSLMGRDFNLATTQHTAHHRSPQLPTTHPLLPYTHLLALTHVCWVRARSRHTISGLVSRSVWRQRVSSNSTVTSKRSHRARASIDSKRRGRACRPERRLGVLCLVQPSHNAPFAQLFFVY
jgi:hypothetical protein